MGRNPLVRRSDRIEAWSFVVAALILAVATPIICAFGTSLQDSRSRTYAEEAMHRHMATATAIEEGQLMIGPSHIWYTAKAQWGAANGRHVGVVRWPDSVKVGDQQRIWVDDDGRLAQPPKPPSRAAVDALAIAIGVWFGVLDALAGTWYAIRRRLDTRRLAQWDVEVSGLFTSDDQRKSQ
ncbi:Rv1733c family protein [Mycolicibacterium stellerae]|uniref:Rv1733c family protein n=1 Tax=Mycolicibacterium stellerae TaxID=2358193 RepID=UPI0019D1D374|nr:hypothetical protein [Mycolicibacterium stellerae]